MPWGVPGNTICYFHAINYGTAASYTLQHALCPLAAGYYGLTQFISMGDLFHQGWILQSKGIELYNMQW